MAIRTDDCDINDVRFNMEHGGNGDYYIVLSEFDKEGQWKKTLSTRFAMSGGEAPTEVKLAVANLYRVMEASGKNQSPAQDNYDRKSNT